MDMKSKTKSSQKFSGLLKLAKTMRTKSDWHREQTIQKWSKFIVEEAAEIREAIRKKDWDELHEEIGDMMWDLAFLAQLAKEQRLFSIHDSIQSAHQKVRRRHPHIFGNKKIKNRRHLWNTYNAIKRQEKLDKQKRKQKKG